MQTKPLDYLKVSALSTWLAFLEHDRDPTAWEQLFGSLEGFVPDCREDSHHSDAFGQVSDHVEQQAQCLSSQLMVV